MHSIKGNHAKVVAGLMMAVFCVAADLFSELVVQ